MTTILTMPVKSEQDVVWARQRARQIAGRLGFEEQDQTRIATAVTEICRNAQMYGKGGRAEFGLRFEGERQALVTRIIDDGPGIRDVPSVLSGRYHSSTGMGVGLVGAKRLMDGFELSTSPSGTTVTLAKNLPRRQPTVTDSELQSIASELVGRKPREPWEEVLTQNRELVAALAALNSRQEELAQLNQELEDTNRGVVALYGDLDRQAEHLRRANELKSTFLSHMSHEFRTPLNSIMALARILLGRMDGPLTQEQAKQVEYILRAAQELTDMVNDLLDLAKVEAGKIEVNCTEWTLGTLFGTLRGMMRPLVANVPVQLVIEEPEDIPTLFTDEGKVTQILRNFVSNAIKFTEAGEIRLSAQYDERNRSVALSVRDTGIGIDPADQPRVFEQFEQAQNERQRSVKGTGLGLPLAKKFAEMLGGQVSVESTPGKGSTFTLTIPVRLPTRPRKNGKPLILIVDDEETARYVVSKQLSTLEVETVEASTGEDAVRLALEKKPELVILDLVMPGLSGYDVAERLKADERTRNIPVIAHSSRTVTDADRERLACAGVVEKVRAEELHQTVADVLGLENP